MQSTVQLFNTALARLGGDQFSMNISPLEDDTVGRICKNLFPHVLDMTLAAHVWAFAVCRKALASPVLADSSGVNPEYPHIFELPSDCVKPLHLEGFEGINRRPSYVIEGSTIRSSIPQVVFVYVSRVTEPKLWPPMFADTLAWAMAGELASAVNNDQQKQEWCYQKYRIALADAVAVDLSDQNPRPIKSEWNEARFRGGY